MTADSAPINLTHHFLIAMPGLEDATFAKTVVYLCEHSERGALGLVINKASDLSMKGLFEKVDLPLLRQDLRELKLYTAVLLWALTGLGLAAFLALQHHAAAALAVLAATLAAPWLAQCWRKRNLAKASYATVSLWLHVGGLLRGLMHRRRDPRSRIPNTVLQRAGDERRPSEPPPRHV